MTRRTVNLTDALHEYLLDHSLRESDILRRLREETGRRDDAQMQIAPEQGQFMRLLVALTGARTALEIGTFTGYSALCIAEALPEGGKLVALDIDDACPAVGRRYWEEAGVGDRIEFRHGPAAESLDDLIAEGAEGAFDFVFIDADKPGMPHYYESSLRLLRTGGLIAVDNTLWSGKVADPSVDDDSTEAIRAFNDLVHGDERVDLSVVPIGDGVTLLRKR